METETISKLLEKLGKQQYTDAIRNFTQYNKRLKIPGFSSMEKAPIKLVANTARTNKAFRKALLESISVVVLPGTDINLDRDIADIKKDLPKTQWLGLAAFLLHLENDTYTYEAERIIDEYDANIPQKKTVHETVSTCKADKKEEKFREKYLRARTEISELTAEMEKQMTQLRDATIKIDELRDEQKKFEQRCTAYLSQIDALNKEKKELLDKLEITQEKVVALQRTSHQKLDIHVLAPSCEDILSIYCDTIPICFENPTKISGREALTKYDEIWVFPNVVPFGTYRTLQKWKQESDEKVIIFQTATDLVSHAERLIRNR